MPQNYEAKSYEKKQLVEDCRDSIRQKAEGQIETIVELTNRSIELHRQIQNAPDSLKSKQLYTDYEMTQFEIDLQYDLMDVFDVLFELLYRYNLELEICEKLGWHKRVAKTVPSRIVAILEADNTEALTKLVKRVEKLLQSLEHKFARSRILRGRLDEKLKAIKRTSADAKKRERDARDAKIAALVKQPIPERPENVNTTDTNTKQNTNTSNNYNYS